MGYKEKFAKMYNEDLIRILADKESYNAEAIDAVKNELLKRDLDADDFKQEYDKEVDIMNKIKSLEQSPSLSVKEQFLTFITTVFTIAGVNLLNEKADYPNPFSLKRKQSNTLRIAFSLSIVLMLLFIKMFPSVFYFGFVIPIIGFIISSKICNKQAENFQV